MFTKLYASLEIHGPCVTGIGSKTMQNGHTAGMCSISEKLCLHFHSRQINRMHVFLKKSSTVILNYMTPFSGAQAIGKGQYGYIYSKYIKFYILFSVFKESWEINLMHCFYVYNVISYYAKFMHFKADVEVFYLTVI